MIKKRTLECKSVSYIDKACDGFMYTFHELIAGNRFFIEYFQNYIARIKDIYIGLCPLDKMEENLEEDFGFPAYGVWKKTMLLLPSITQERRTIRERGKTLLTIPTKFIVPEKF